MGRRWHRLRPGVLGAARYNLLTIGITNDESEGNALLATPRSADGFMKNPQSIKGQTIVLTANSTGDYAVQSCLAKWGLKKADVTIKSMGQAEIISAMSTATPTSVVCGRRTSTRWKRRPVPRRSARAGTPVPPCRARSRARRLREGTTANVAKFLAVYLRAWKWMNAHQPEAIAMMKKFYEQGGVTISEASMKKEFTTRPTYDLAGQLKIMDRPRRASEVDNWLTQIGEFMKANGTFPEAPTASRFVTDEYLRIVDPDPRLKAFANRTD